jgi:hypothetical protein
MWWIEGTHGYTARGSFGHILAVYPARDLVMVIRADTYHDRSVSTRACMRLFDLVVRAGQGNRADAPRLVRASPVERNNRPDYALSGEQITIYPCEITMDSGRKVTVTASDGGLTIEYGNGTFRLWPESDTRFICEDSEDPVLFELGPNGRVSKIWAEQLCYLEAAAAVKRGDLEAVLTWVRRATDKFPESARAHFTLAKVLRGTGKPKEALPHVQKALEIDPAYEDAQWLLMSLRFRRFAWVGGILASMVGLALVLAFVRRRQHRSKPGPTDHA